MMTQGINRRAMCCAIAALTSLFAQAPAWAAGDYPNKPIRFVVGYAAGGATDVLARLVANKMGEDLGQPIVVENRPGANSNVGADLVARAPANGYTVYVYTIANTINASLYSKLSYDPIKDLEPVGLIAKIPNLLVVPPSLPVKTVKDYVKFAKETPNGITFASSGSGSSVHLSGEMFKMKTGLNMLHVPYKGSAPAVTDLLGGQVQSMFDNAPSVMPHVKAGKLRAIAITSRDRSPLLPDVPTIAESGYPGFEVQSWFGLVVPAGTDKEVIAKLNLALNKVLATSDVKQRLGELLATPTPGSTDQMRQFVLSQIQSWREVVRASGAKAE